MDFKNYVIQNHPDPEAVFGFNEYDFNQILLLAENFAKDYHKKQLKLGGVVGQSEQLKAFVDWWHGLSQEELAWYEGRYVDVFESL